MSAPGSHKQREDARRWLDRAEADIASARVLLNAAPPHLSTTAYLCQQAIEKLLKGLLTLAAVPFRKTHNLDELAAQLSAPFPELAAHVQPLRSRSSWGFAFRYPGDDALPSLAQVEAVLSKIEALRAEVVQRLR